VILGDGGSETARSGLVGGVVVQSRDHHGNSGAGDGRDLLFVDAEFATDRLNSTLLLKGLTEKFHH
jgi:hypothetical protein